MDNQPGALPTEQEMKIYALIAKTASSTPYWTKLGGESGVLSIMLLARELGISPMNAISGMFHPVQGKVEISAKGITYLIRRGGHQCKLVLLTAHKCILKGRRCDTGEEMEVTYSLEDASCAGLLKNGGGWTKHPKDMLFARAISRLGRWLFTDCLGSCYVEGELQETIEKKKVEAPPEIDLTMIELEQDIPLDLPEDVAGEQVEDYLRYLCEEYHRPKNDFLREAVKRPEDFFLKVKEFQERETEKEEVG